MARPLTKQKALLNKAFNDTYHRKVNAPFGVLASPRNFNHDGVDYGADKNEPLYPMHDQVEITKVVNNVNQNFSRSTGTEKDFGNYVIYYIPAWDVSVLYAHLMNVTAKVGFTGYKQLAVSHNTGLSTGAHLHLGIAKGRHTSLSSIRKNGFDFEKFVPEVKENEVEEDGEITVTVDVGLRVRQEPSLNAKQTGLLPKGTKKVYTHFVDNEGIRWVKLKEGGYTARRTLDNKKVYASARFLNDKPQAKPKPKPRPTKIGKYANFGGNVRLFQKAVGDECYHSTKNGQRNVYTNVRNTSAKVLDEKNGRVLVSVPRFNPNRVWIANAESSISTSAKYKL